LEAPGVDNVPDEGKVFINCNGRNMRLTDVAGELIPQIVA
jgi:hypothetical protein